METLLTQILANLGTALVAAAGAGGFLWWLLQRAIDQKLSLLLKQQETALAASLHKENTVYARVDQQRSDAVQTLNAHIRAHKWSLIEFTPKSTFKVGAERSEAKVDAITWCFMLQQQGNETMKEMHGLSLLIPKELGANVAAWALHANQIAIALVHLFLENSAEESFLSLSDEEQRSRFRATKEQFLKEHGTRYFEVTERVLDELRSVFVAEGSPPPISALFDEALKQHVTSKPASALASGTQAAQLPS